MRSLLVAMTFLLTTFAHAGAIQLQFVRGSDKGPLTVRITKRESSSPLATKTISPNESSVTFDGLAAGAYLLVVEGDEPLKRMQIAAIAAANGTRRVRVEIPRGMVFGRFTMGGRPLANARVSLSHANEGWSAKLTTKANGTYASALWRRGEYDVAVDEMPVGALMIPEGPAPNVDFDVPDRRVAGRVTTANGAPAANVLVALESSGPSLRRVLRQRSDANGKFSYFGVPAGQQVLRVIGAEGYLRPDPISFDLGAADTNRDVAVVLKNGAHRTVRVVDHRGDARADAAILCVTGNDIRSAATTNADGAARIDTPPAEESVLYVIPREGSLAMERVDHGDETIRIRVPSAGASIDLVAKTTDGAVLHEVAFLMRFNGEIVPPEVVRQMQIVQGARLLTDDKGLARLPDVPPGYYEFWPFRTDDEVTAILDTAGAFDPPIRLNARIGENRVTVQFERRP